ncbi:MAG: hypothetical protein LAO05_06235 [Acidobacteriia bacterium]|nr:hypothetical protein [Terriglobia bacterium]
MTEPLERSELLWRQYELEVDLYKHHFDQAVRINTLYSIITGAILSFYLSQRSVPTAKWALALPLLLSVGLAGASFYGACLLGNSRKDLIGITKALNLPYFPETRVLSCLLILSGLGGLLVAIGLGWLLLQ